MAEVKKVIVFGATGTTGLAIVKRALKEKLELTLYVRTPSKVPEEFRKDVKIVEGDVLDKEKVENAIEGQQAVLSCIGTGLSFSSTTVISEGCKNIISGMKKHQVRKLVVMSVAFLLPGRSVIFFLKKIIEDHERQYNVLKNESEHIDWIAVAAPRVYKEDMVNDTYKVEKGDCTGADRVTSAECADFMVKVLNEPERYKDLTHQFAGISSKPKKKGWFS